MEMKVRCGPDAQSISDLQQVSELELVEILLTTISDLDIGEEAFRVNFHKPSVELTVVLYLSPSFFNASCA